MKRATSSSWSRFAETIIDGPGWPRAIDLRSPLSEDDRAFLSALVPSAEWAIVTSANPLGALLGEAANAERLHALADELRARLIVHVRADGMSPDRSHVERGFAVAATREQAIELAARYEQLGLFWFDGNRMWIVPVLARETPVALPRARAAD
ncbi:MAG: DUF3293 domain-containing protein [Phycisphaerales bacterium]